MFRSKKSDLQLTDEAKSLREHYKNDRLAFFRDCLRVRDRSGDGLVPLNPNHCQLALLNLIERAERFLTKRKEYIGGNEKTQVNIVVLKPRKEGISTLVSALGFHMCEFYPSTNTLIMAHRKDGADNIATISRRFYQQFPSEHKEIKVPIVKEGTVIEWGSLDNTAWDSRMIIASASNESVARGFDFNFIHISEEAFFKSPDALSATKIAGQQAKYVIEESTANGKDTSFYPGWKSAMYLEDLEAYWNENKATPQEWNGKIRFFWAWWQDPEYQKAVTDTDIEQMKRTLDPEEETLQRLYKLSWEQLAWRRHTIRTRCSDQTMMSPEDFFRQEFPSDPESVFVASGNTVFSLPCIEEQKKKQPDPKTHGFVLSAESIQDVLIKPSSRNHEQSNYKVYKEPEPGQQYILATTSKRNEADVCALAVFLRSGAIHLEEVLSYRGGMESTHLANLAIHLGYKYNGAYMINNATAGGVMTCQRIARLGYPTIYRRRNEELIGEQNKVDAFVPGIKVWRQNDQLIVEHLKEAVLLNRIFIKSEWILEDMTTFENDAGKLQAPEGAKDHGVWVAGLSVYANNMTAPPIVEKENTREAPKTEQEYIWDQIQKKKEKGTKARKQRKARNPFR